ncbi:hypothetical protein FACS1894113_5140 [Alphaproteobacteria bacterium]|nr:hypothetical protein FACS1894113_5140 [Alphaproteobacteria bacterium]
MLEVLLNPTKTFKDHRNQMKDMSMACYLIKGILYPVGDENDLLQLALKTNYSALYDLFFAFLNLNNKIAENSENDLLKMLNCVVELSPFPNKWDEHYTACQNLQTYFSDPAIGVPCLPETLSDAFMQEVMSIDNCFLPKDLVKKLVNMFTVNSTFMRGRVICNWKLTIDNLISFIHAYIYKYNLSGFARIMELEQLKKDI